MSNDHKNCGPLRTEWVPSAYRDEKGKDRSSPGISKPVTYGFAKKTLKMELGKRK
ncbi:hypothetical protein [Mucilaginibacter defluvii]|uniref:hypothetical protein n=1 Tax=Mucilaginibacter defluvii TaxID=1196019 RepID=UPI0031EDF3D2